MDADADMCTVPCELRRLRAKCAALIRTLIYAPYNVGRGADAPDALR